MWNLNLKLIIKFFHLHIIPMTLFNDIMTYFDEFIHVYGWNMSILWSPINIWMPKSFTTASFRHPVTKSWLRHCLEPYIWLKLCYHIIPYRVPSSTYTCPATLLSKGAIGLGPKYYLPSRASQGLFSLPHCRFLPNSLATCNRASGYVARGGAFHGKPQGANGTICRRKHWIIF